MPQVNNRLNAARQAARGQFQQTPIGSTSGRGYDGTPGSQTDGGPRLGVLPGNPMTGGGFQAPSVQQQQAMTGEDYRQLARNQLSILPDFGSRAGGQTGTMPGPWQGDYQPGGPGGMPPQPLHGLPSGQLTMLPRHSPGPWQGPGPWNRQQPPGIRPPWLRPLPQPGDRQQPPWQRPQPQPQVPSGPWGGNDWNQMFGGADNTSGMVDFARQRGYVSPIRQNPVFASGMEPSYTMQVRPEQRDALNAFMSYMHLNQNQQIPAVQGWNRWGGMGSDIRMPWEQRNPAAPTPNAGSHQGPRIPDWLGGRLRQYRDDNPVPEGGWGGHSGAYNPDGTPIMNPPDPQLTGREMVLPTTTTGYAGGIYHLDLPQYRREISLFA